MSQSIKLTTRSLTYSAVLGNEATVCTQAIKKNC